MEILGKELDDMHLSHYNKAVIATPCLHLPSVNSYIAQNSDYFVVNESIKYSELQTLLASRSDITSLFVNPNSQGYKIDRDLLKSSAIKSINTCSTGTNHIDKEYCSLNNISIYSLTRDYDLINNLPSTAELAFAMLLGLYRNLPACTNLIKSHRWEYQSVMGHQLSNANIGVLGYGRLGKIFCRQLEGFAANISVCEKDASINIPSKYSRVSIEDLFMNSDAVVLHIHADSYNTNLISSDLLQTTKKGFYLVNTSRGEIVCEQAIADFIESGHLSGYATDVLANEFDDISKSPILKLFDTSKYNIIITPHVGGMTFEGQEKAFLYALQKYSIL